MTDAPEGSPVTAEAAAPPPAPTVERPNLRDLQTHAAVCWSTLLAAGADRWTAAEFRAFQVMLHQSREAVVGPEEVALPALRHRVDPAVPVAIQESPDGASADWWTDEEIEAFLAHVRRSRQATIPPW